MSQQRRRAVLVIMGLLASITLAAPTTAPTTAATDAIWSHSPWDVAWAQQSAESEFFATPLTTEEMSDTQAVIETSEGTIIIQLLPDAAPNHVGYFMKLAGEGAYDGTTFHRVVRLGIVQGGDPLSTDPAKRELYGTGGLGVLRAEPNDEPHTRGAVSAVLQPDRPDSAGAQFFISVTDQPALDGSYTVFGRVVEGITVAARISELTADEEGHLVDRVEILSVTIRDTPPPEPVPFETETAEELARWHAVLETSAGPITLELLPDVAPTHVRTFLRLAALGVYDGTIFHRVVPGFVIQGGGMSDRREPPSEKQEAVIGTLEPEFSDIPHVKGVVSMARGDDPASASTSFFICTGPASSLDGQYTVFARVVDGLEVVETIEQAPTVDEAPVTRIEIRTVQLEER